MPWIIKGRPYNKSHTNFTGSFPESICRSKTTLWIPHPKKNVNPLILCVHKGFCGEENKFDKSIDEIKKISDCADDEAIHQIANHYGVLIHVYRLTYTLGGRSIRFDAEYGRPGENKRAIPLLQNMCNKTPITSWALIFPGNAISNLLAKKYCEACGKWIQSNFDKHRKGCYKCGCGTSYSKGSEHPLHCNKSNYKEKKEIDACKIYKKETGDWDIRDCYFADFETLTDMRGRYRVYAACVMDSVQETSDDTLWIGMDSLKEFVDYIMENCNGVLWFYNGSRFDNYFLLEYFVANKVPISDIVKSGNSILTMKIKTKNGQIVIKDLLRFMNGSLDDNCKAFGIPVDKSKGHFDHRLIKSFGDADKYSKLIKDYLDKDVVSMREIYKVFSKTIWDAYKLQLSKFVTQSHLSYAAFTTNLPYGLLYKTPIEDEKIMRDCYKGGRVVPGRKRWQSKQWKSVLDNKFPNIQLVLNEKTGYKEWTQVGWCIDDETYNNIDDYYCYGDVNSLYPAAQVGRKYPVGRYKKRVIEKKDSDRMCNNLNNLVNKDYWWRVQALVDVDCPNNLNIAFLMTRKDGEVKQDLLPKRKKWYTGVELYEAVTLGYVITRIYEVVEWPRAQNIFESYVLPTYKRKKDNFKDTPPYTEAKGALNGLTGKFGQHVNLQRIHVYGPNDVIDVGVHDVTRVVNDKGETVGWYAVSDVRAAYCPYPIDKSSFILAHSKVIMSQIMKAMYIPREEDDEETAALRKKLGAYMETDLCPGYGDTDSLMVHRKLWDALPSHMKGDKDLGQLKLEINGKILDYTVLAPKTYNFIYVDEKTKQVLSITKAKGIPHTKAPHDAFGLFPLDELKVKKANDIYKHLEKRSNILQSCKEVELRDRFYLIFMDGNLLHSCYIIPPTFIPGILEGEMEVLCLFGGMRRRFECTAESGLYVMPDYNRREYNKNIWWSSCQRQHLKEGEYPTSLPEGHYLLL